MKNLINYYYNLIVNQFRKSEDNFTFDINNKKYIFLQFDGDVNELYKIYILLSRNNRYCHEIIVNKDNSILTLYNNKPYILLKENLSLKNKVSFDDIINYDKLVYENYKLNWKELWKNKIDYYEYQVNQFGFKYRIISESFSYYIGLSELAISLLNYVDTKNINCYICHKRINYNETMRNFLNPVNIIIDNRIRDIAEYFKINYINENLSIQEVFNYLDKIKLNNNECILLLSRLLYPTYYFDVYDKVIQGKIRDFTHYSTFDSIF